MLFLILLLYGAPLAKSENITTGGTEIVLEDDRGHNDRLTGTGTRTGHVISDHSYNDPGSWPWAVSIGEIDEENGNWIHVCDGVIITNTHIITSHTCIDVSIDDEMDVKNLLVRAGDNWLTSITEDPTTQVLQVGEYTKHPDQDYSSYYNDIAVITLLSAWNITEFVRPADLPTLEEAKLTPPAKDTALSLTICGWGGREKVVRLMDAVVTSQSKKYCDTVYDGDPGKINSRDWIDGVLCAVSLLDLSGTCSGGAGSGLFYLNHTSNRYVLKGILVKDFDSDTEGSCGSPKKPNMFVRVSSMNIINFLYETIHNIPNIDNDSEAFQNDNNASQDDSGASQNDSGTSQDDSGALQDDSGESQESLDEYYENCGVNDVIDKVFNGNMNAPEGMLGRWPWLVAFYVNEHGVSYNFTCGATILTSTKLLTAAHCFDILDTKNPEGMKIRAGDVKLRNSIDDSNMIQEIELNKYDITRHDRYNENRHFDLAIINLNTSLEFNSHVQPVCLLSEADAARVTSDEDALSLVVSGWGKTVDAPNEGKAGGELKHIVASVYSRDFCDKEYSDIDGRDSDTLPDGFTDEVLCAGDPSGWSGTCHGDSGGGAVTFDEARKRFILRAVVSGSKKGDCGTKDDPNIYARLSNADITQWIFDNINFIAPTQVELAFVGDETKLTCECKAEANPEPQISWMLSDDQDNIYTTFTQTNSVEWSGEKWITTSRISSPKLRDNIIIKCTAKNFIGQHSDKLRSDISPAISNSICDVKNCQGNKICQVHVGFSCDTPGQEMCLARDHETTCVSCTGDDHCYPKKCDAFNNCVECIRNDEHCSQDEKCQNNECVNVCDSVICNEANAECVSENREPKCHCKTGYKLKGNICELDPESATSCMLGATTCHSNAKCVDYNPGFCCQCQPGYFGNGDNCLQNGLPQRGTGAINGIMNGVEMVLERDLHFYIVTQDGRTYTALSRVPRQIGWDLQALLPVGNAMSWLFATQQDGGLNGFTLTGGVFNYTAEVYFPDTGHRATIIFACNGLDLLDALKADLYLKGNIPPIPVGTYLRIGDFFQDFTKVNPGEIHARSKRQYEVQGTNRIVQLDVEHTITYEDCASRPYNADLKTLRLMSSSNYIRYDEDEQIIRYASASHVKPLGHTCTPVCSPDADCVPMANQEYGCRCKRNFYGDGLECEPSPRQDGNFMLLGQGMFVLNVPFIGKGSKPINVLSSQVATGIDIDCMKGLVYWSDTNSRVIRRSNINGSNAEIFLDADIKFPEGIAVDWVSRNVYWTDPGKDTIEVANMETKERRVIFRDDLRQPRSIVVHPRTGNIIWTDWDGTKPKIEISGMDGSERRTLVNVNLGEPSFLTTDYPNCQVCWTDGGSKKFHVTPRVDCIGIPHGGGRRTILELTAGEFPYGLAMTENNVYWTDWKNKKMIHSADKISGKRQRSIKYPLAGIGGKPYDLVNVPEECPIQRSSCQYVSCPGTMLCLPNERGHTCACSDQEKLQGCVDINY